ncbi:VOC family protein [Sinorhizobium meliloti]|uniref:VOC family protein n=1 Tax=Rhizobium meliloti TaxID=382 RepID=UPI0020919FB7|nr:VOC family protein [Sinorhizobium meliloti]MCO5963635.1 VOC family protein [Sinorhizobium meliloti]MDW9414275.1 VOC family protein [Sinorhizobium meliloti]MDW9509411.1 VOC family protein [Sinorhizobium meliloti]
MKFAQLHPIQDVCILVTDVEASIRFYTQKLGFELKHRAPGFADFIGAGLTLALWERSHIESHTDVRVPVGSASAVLVAVRVDSPADIDVLYADLEKDGVAFVNPPADYPWNARCLYFRGPDGETWELYAWLDGGAPGRVAA